MARPYFQVDVFSAESFRGNPLAVIMDADDLSENQMLAIANWTNLSETAFLLAPSTPDADYRVRIFTPTGELPFAGHPTLGSAHAFLENGGTSRGTHIIQECAAGLVQIKTQGEYLAFEAPPTIKSGELIDADLDGFLTGLGMPKAQVLGHQWVDNGPGWAAIELPSAQHVLDMEPDFALLADLKVGIFGAYPQGSPHAFEVRAFAPGIGEDPVTGSLNAAIAQWLFKDNRVADGYIAAQGSAVGRAGEIHISVEGETIWVGGSTRTLFSGVAHL